MTKVSRRLLDKQLEDYIFRTLLNTLADLKTPQEVNTFLKDLLSPVEKIMLTKRLAIAIMLTKGYSFDEIDHTLKVSRATITNVSYSLKYGQNGGYQKVAEKVISEQKKEAVFDKIEEILIQLSPPKIYGNPVYERKRKLGKELFIKKLLRGKL